MDAHTLCEPGLSSGEPRQVLQSPEMRNVVIYVWEFPPLPQCGCSGGKWATVIKAISPSGQAQHS